MPANLPPDYFSAEKRYREASSVQEKIDCLKEMLAIMPKHKGTEHLQGDLKRRIAKLHQQSQKKHLKSKSSGLDHIPKEGAGQAVLVGGPNTGKSSILNFFTNARSVVAEYPFSTFKPIYGMMRYEDIAIQLVDIPPISPNYQESWMYNIIRLADLIIFTIDLGSKIFEEQVTEVYHLLDEHNIQFKKEGESHPQGSIAIKTTIIVGTKHDLTPGMDGSSISQILNQEILPYIEISIKENQNVDTFRRIVFQALRILRIYTKIPGKPADYEKPYIFNQGTTVLGAAEMIHKELSLTMKYARIWGSEKYNGQRVEKDHILEDRDVIEIHTR